MAGKHLDLSTGVEFVGDTIRIRFSWKGADPVRRCETLSHLSQSQAGIKAATNLRAEVVKLIKLGVMDDEKYAALFPNTSYVTSRPASTFGEYAQLWLNTREIVKGTRANYLATLNNHWMPYFAPLPLTAISTTDIRKVVANTEWESPNAKRTALIRIRAVLKSAVNDGLLERNPAASMELPRKSKRKLNPFTQAEADQVIEQLYSSLAGKRTEIYAAYIEFSFYTGMRPGEIRALKWEEVDLKKRVAHICRIAVDGGVAERIKNGKTRNVLLNDRAMHALGRAKEVSKSIKLAGDFVFPPAQQSEQMVDPTGPNGYYQAAVKALGISRRRLYDTRHTYATMCLMAGMNVAFIANQLGHTIEVLLSTYAEWINSDGDWSELAKLSTNAIGTKSVHG